MAITLTLTKAGATAYTLRNLDGNVVTSGPVSGSRFTIQPPVGGFRYGWHRCYITGPIVDGVYGNSYGVANILIIPEDANFPPLPATVGYDRFGTYIPDGAGSPPSITDPSTWPTGRALFGSPIEGITRSCLGIGMGRLETGSIVVNPNTFTDEIEDHRLFMTNVMKPYWLDVSEGGNVDPVRTRYQWLGKPGFFDSDFIIVPAWGILFAKTPGATQANISVEITPGSSSGYKVIVRNSDSTVETFDNLASNTDFKAAINTGTPTVNSGNPSNYIRFYLAGSGNETVMQATVDSGAFGGIEVVSGSGAKAFGTTFRDYMISSVGTLYPVGVTRFEGPFNEPGASSTDTGEFVTQYQKTFHEAVKAGNASAVVLGPATVNISDLDGTTGPQSTWKNLLDAGILNYIDELSFHAYNTIVNGDLNKGRSTIETFLEFLAGYGADAMTMWHTEAAHAIVSVGGNPSLPEKYAVYCPRRARNAVYYWLLFDQYGLPFERNAQWYDYSHGFWPYPSFMFMSLSADRSSNPQVGLLATLAREAFGKLYDHRVDFGSEPANHIFFGSVYGTAATGSMLTLLSMSYIDGGTTVTLAITGTTDPIVTVDEWGNETSKSQSSGRITVDVTDMPRYVRLPAGANATVYSVAPAGVSWGTSPPPSISAGKQTALIGSGLNRPGLADDTYMTVYESSSRQGITFSDIEPPDNADVLLFDGDSPSVFGVVIWCGPHFQDMPGLLDYDVYTTTDGGSTWTLQKTVTRSVSSFVFGSDDSDAGCAAETFCKEQWIETVVLDTPVVCNGIRVHVRGLTCGGMPDLLAANMNAWHGDSLTNPKLAIEEIAILSADSLNAPSDYPTTILADSPGCWWRLNESSGSTAVSEVNSPGCDATYAGTVTYGQPGVIAGNNCFTNSSGAQLTIPDATQTRVGDTFTLECWIYLTNSAAVFRGLMNKGSGAYQMGLDTSRHLRLIVGSLSQVVATSTVAVPLNSWTHCVVVKDGSSSTHLYLNGVDVTGTVTDHTSASGAGAAGNFFSGFASGEHGDEPAIYPTPLSPSRVLAHFKAGSFPGAPGNQRAPKLEGSPVVGNQLRCLPGRWAPPANAYTYQWKSASTLGGVYSNIGGATKSTFVLTAGESGKYVKCLAAGAAVGGTGTAVASNAVGPVT